MDLPSISDINSMKRDDLRGVLIDIIKKRNNADTPDVVKRSVRSVFHDDKSKNEIIMSEVKEGENDQQYVPNVCKIIHFEGQPTYVVRLGRKKDGHPRPLRVTFSSPFDARVFRARFVDHRKTDENAGDTKGVHITSPFGSSRKMKKVNGSGHRIGHMLEIEQVYTEDHHENHQRPGTPPNELNCLYLNARSVKSVTNKRNKPVELQHILSTFEVHFVAITETWLTEDVLDSEVLPQNMQCHRKDRSETRQSAPGGSLLLGIDNRLTSKRRPDLECECEILVCEISGLSRVNIAIILVYRPPSSDCATFTSLLDETLCKVSTEYSNICLLGDFNMLNIDWHALDIVSSTADATFIPMTQSHALDQLNTRASNAHGTCLDLLFCNDSTLLCNISHLDDEFNFDEHHRILLFNMLLHIPLLHRQPRRIFNYKRADLTSLCEHLSNVYLNLDFALNNTHFGENHTFASKKLRKSQFCLSHQYDWHNTHCDYRGYVV
ncbi:hypothetical protein CAPTEDRAFT_213191 [Capitella teleta]|uniref:Endonuclease/exonuclease/phosphatase domain-containing protein n=1 Tax=Capitella teleta TaxID=283909 RepID=R7VA01_CAPTE|nr:hypothetical protein CAPTEDRAFT_213191 [Capitella teleta]|eukprot:ELU13156.1 hypothetical protein CAPTEDRAFT_213191 [Capitella teleta]